MLNELTNNNFDTETKDGLKVIEFYAPWCGYCKKQEEELTKMDKVWIGQVNADNNTELAIRFGIHSFPTFLVMNNGKEVERFSGLRKKEDLMNTVMKHLKG